MAYKCGVLLESYIHQMFFGAVYLFHNNYDRSLKQVLLIPYILMILSGCGAIMNKEGPKPDRSIKFSTIKKVVIKKLSFLPYINYIPDVDPTESGKVLLDELSIYENIVNDHVQFDLSKEDQLDPDGKNQSKGRLRKFFDRKNTDDSIEEKVADINEIRKLTARYEKWSLAWDEKANLVGQELSLDEIDLIKSEIKRISRKL